MKNKLIIMLTTVLSLLLASCSGTQDTQIYDLTIKVDRNEIIADGLDKVTVTVYYGSEDVSLSDKLSIYAEGESGKVTLPGGSNTFSTYETGSHRLHASFLDGSKVVFTEEDVEITAVKAGSHASSGYQLKMLAMCFTSIWCQYCPMLHQAVKEIQEETPGRIIPMAVHLGYMGSDPFADGMPLNGKFYSLVNTGEDKALPLFSMNLRKSSQHISNEKVKILSEMDRQSRDYPAFCGISINSIYEMTGSIVTINVKAGFKADVSGYYNYHIFILEDGVMMEQSGDQAYIHDNLLRHAAADNVYGSKINQGNILSAGKEYQIEKSISLGYDLKPENMRVVVSMLHSSDGGKTFVINNSAECPLKGSADYSFAKQ